MGVKSNINKIFSTVFLVVASIFVAILFFASINARKIAANWQSVNDQVTFDAQLKNLK